ncbi:hypothetical protein TSUD_124200 [Trifolium subterraneum]|uniref:Uncharacterized protein n=1 Tax=Trifolium subterraneum TaxID=3900 RepID=A0A2Z6LL61_TRISU|nr:hypothetical protein TSUD_124200 [Trifolium subterraneum]
MEVTGEPIRVQSLIQSGLSHVPSQYIQPPQNRPTIQTDPNSNIPIIDLFNFNTNHRSSIREAIGYACREWGAFHVTNHGIPTTLLHSVRNSGLTFFNDCPMSEKLKYPCTPGAAASEGYGSRMLATSDKEQNDAVSEILDWRDYFDHHTFPLSRRNPNNWPNFTSDYRESVAKYSDEMKILAQKLLSLISEINEVGLLWHQIITNGKYRSCVHRAVTNPNRPRLSVATFHDPAKTAKICPVPELINDSSPAKYRGVVYGDYVSSWYTKGPDGKRNIDALVIES